MAKGPFWLRGAKGKLAGSVIYKGESGTVVRENVKPKNTQSNSQMKQRIAFATVTQAAKMMLPIIGISFEGEKSKKLSRRKFVQLNSSQFGRYAQQDNDQCAWSTKGNMQLIPNPYIVSRGSLETPEILKPKFGDGDSHSVTIAIHTHTFAPRVYTPFEIWREVFGVRPGGQITFPQIQVLNGAEKFIVFEERNEIGAVDISKYDYIRYSRFSAPRIVLNTELPQGDFSVDFSDPSVDHSRDITLALDKVIDKDKSDSIAYGMITNAVTQDQGNTYEWEIDWTMFELDSNWSIRAIGTILSNLDRNGSWLYSNCDLLVKRATFPINADYYGCRLPIAYQTYLTSANRENNYLQTGGDGGDID